MGNFGDGTINAFDPKSGAALGTPKDLMGGQIVLQGLWSLNFGSPAKNADPGALYFTAGPGGGPNNDPVESHGLFGSIQAAPSFQTSGVENAASLLAGPVAPNAWMTIGGTGPAPPSRQPGRRHSPPRATLFPRR